MHYRAENKGGLETYHTRLAKNLNHDIARLVANLVRFRLEDQLSPKSNDKGDRLIGEDLIISIANERRADGR
jgi:hypothetical protein